MSFWSELKRRGVIKVGVTYAIVGLAVGEGADIFLPQLGAPTWVVPVILALVAFALPVALVLAWAYDVTPEGIERTGAAGAGSTVAESGLATETTALAEPPAATAPSVQNVSAETSQAVSAPLTSPLREHERLVGERVLQRRDDRGHPRPDLAHRGARRRLPHIGQAIQGQR